MKKLFKNQKKKSQYRKLEAIKNNFQKSWKNKSKPDQKEMLEEFGILFAYNSCKMEGSSLTLKEVREIIKNKTFHGIPLNKLKVDNKKGQ